MISQVVIEGEKTFLRFWCEGCNTHHQVPVDGSHPWSWNGRTDEPTLHPSILVTRHVGPERVPHICHSFVTDGQIQYLGDCTHKLAGQTVPLSQMP